jgi:hypothetical protein
MLEQFVQQFKQKMCMILHFLEQEILAEREVG